jgi:hypothetical protein
MRLYKAMWIENELTVMDFGFLECGEHFRVARRTGGVKLFREMD